MDCSEHPTGSGGRSPARREVQGPRPTPLKVRKDFDKFKKPPHPPQHRPPVIIYTVSPKVIHTNPSDFMSLVQRLTGAASSSTSTSVASETVRKLATIEKPLPLAKRDNDVLNPLGFGDVATSFNHAGILSPVPASLPAISPNFFSPPAVDISNSLSFLPDLSPGIFSGNHKNYADNSFLISPGNLLSSHIAPTPSGYWDLFNQYDQGL
ncbi:nuclear speckle RNA-binding protein B-like [Asparagus officinalis]|uniref:nuclear speckle RNA-binding protein B-like n=1 Tax=Asparagus officinalis TaxID=4686 RepID=UPI00098E0408|nr:nuclear speckle RNA-binding protein B-like [Asparagus officinalis]